MEDNLLSEEELIQAKKARINELKNAIEGIRSLGFQPPHDMVFELEQLESLVLVNYELIPTLTGLLENEFGKFKSEVNLLLRYSPEEGLDISFYNEKRSNPKATRTQKGKIKIELSNGDVIKCMFGGDTLAKFIEFVGAKNVHKLNMRTGSIDGKRLIITKEQFEDIGDEEKKICRYKQVGYGYYVHTCLTTERKVDIINSIIEELGVEANVVVE